MNRAHAELLNMLEILFARQDIARIGFVVKDPLPPWAQLHALQCPKQHFQISIVPMVSSSVE